MSRTVTLSQLRTDIRFQADLVGATLRHDNTSITRLINQSIQRFRDRITLAGDTYYLVTTTTTISSGAESTSQSYRIVDISGLSPEPVRTYGVDLLRNGIVETLHHVPFEARNDFGGGKVTGPPTAWSHLSKDEIAILPTPDNSYTARLYYLPVLSDLSGDSDTFDGVAGWEEFIVLDVACRLILRDQYPAVAMLNDYRRELWAELRRTAARATHAGGAHLGRDTLGQRLGAMVRKYPPPS